MKLVPWIQNGNVRAVFDTTLTLSALISGLAGPVTKPATEIARAPQEMRIPTQICRKTLVFLWRSKFEIHRMKVSLRLEETSGIIRWCLWGSEMPHGDGCTAAEMSDCCCWHYTSSPELGEMSLQPPEGCQEKVPHAPAALSWTNIEFSSKALKAENFHPRAGDSRESLVGYCVLWGLGPRQ